MAPRPFKLKLYGEREFISFLRSMSEDVINEFESVLQEEAQAILAESQARAPKRTGQLASSAQGPFAQRYDDGKSITFTISFSAQHAQYVGKARRSMLRAGRKRRKKTRERCWQALVKLWNARVSKVTPR